MSKVLRSALAVLLAAASLLSVPLAAASPAASLMSTQSPPSVSTTEIPWETVDASGHPYATTVHQYVYTFSTVPTDAEELAQYDLDSPYTTMALLILALRTWTPEDPSTCLQMLDLLTDTGVDKPGAGRHYLFSEYKIWADALKERMEQGKKWRYIGDAYLGGATPQNDYTPTDPVTITLRESPYVPYAAATDTAPEQHQVLISIPGAENDRYSLFYQDEGGDWKVYGINWRDLLADVQIPDGDIPLPPEPVRPASPAHPQTEPALRTSKVPAKAVGVDEDGKEIILDVEVEQYTYTFSTVPASYEDLVQYKLDSPYKTMALLFMAYRTWTPDDPSTCMEMLDYLTNTAVDSGEKDASGHILSTKASDYKPWVDFVRDRMRQNEKWRYIGNAYLGGAGPLNDYAPTEPVTVTLRQSVYDPYAAGDAATPRLTQVLIHIDGADNDRYSIFYQDQRGDWRVWGDNWKGLLADVQTPLMDICLPPETVREEHPRTRQTEPVESVYDIPAQAPAIDDRGDPIVIDTTVQQHTYTFSTVPTSYEDLVQYKSDSPYKAMALLIMAFRTWTPDDPSVCLHMLDYLTDTGVDSGKKDADGRKLSRPASEYVPWTQFINDRMRQGEKWRYIGDAYLGGAMPSNDYTPTDPFTVTVRQSVYDPYKPEGSTGTEPALYQVLISLPGADNDRYAIFYQDPRGDWRVYGDYWKGLLTDVQTPGSDLPWPPAPDRSVDPVTPQTEPVLTTRKVPGKAMAEDEHGDLKVIDIEVDEYTYTFSTVPTCYEDLVQYELDSPYKTMALLFLTYRTWRPEDPSVCLRMLDYLTDTAVPSGTRDASGHLLSRPFSEYIPWIAALRDRMVQNDKWQYIGNAYLKGASPGNGYTPSSPVTVTVRQSAYDPYKAATATTPELVQVLVSIDGADNDRYSIFYQDQRGDWRVSGDHWQGLLADVKVSGYTPAPPQIWGTSLSDPEDGSRTLSFNVSEVGAADLTAMVASYTEEGKLLSVTEALSAGDSGAYMAKPDPDAASCRIAVLDRSTLRPLCPPKIVLP